MFPLPPIMSTVYTQALTHACTHNHANSHKRTHTHAHTHTEGENAPPHPSPSSHFLLPPPVTRKPEARDLASVVVDAERLKWGGDRQ
jgi:hypothetical protein